MENQVVVSDYAQMDRVLKEERQYILNIVKQIKKANCNVLLIQKSILRYKKLPSWLILHNPFLSIVIQIVQLKKKNLHYSFSNTLTGRILKDT